MIAAAVGVVARGLVLDVGVMAGPGVTMRGEGNALGHRHCQECRDQQREPEEANDSLYRQFNPAPTPAPGDELLYFYCPNAAYLTDLDVGQSPTID
jgi:hypothetical protein